MYPTLTKELDTRVQEFFSRPIAPHIPYLFVDASSFTVRDSVRYYTPAITRSAGIRTDGMREILGARIADCENERTWENLFSELKDRGLERVDLVISDGHRGIQSATGRSFLEVGVGLLRVVAGIERNVGRLDGRQSGLG
ncbi:MULTISPECIES: transposase [unclassified Methanoculleus]|jgi:transposase-like protein|uniref:Transposase n=1 Tax=Methanoculleus palmolei TaxID=72612 RepID=A0ABD8A7E1_9EURY|nr:transposase [Methanoculleus sp. UBA377]WOX55464.1 transposase [Methanoculleus palmolei]